jgi:hypothetical protein
MCTIYATEALQALAREPVCWEALEKLSGEWGSVLWKLLLVEPDGASYWVRPHPASHKGRAILWSVLPVNIATNGQALQPACRFISFS